MPVINFIIFLLNFSRLFLLASKSKVTWSKYSCNFSADGNISVCTETLRNFEERSTGHSDILKPPKIRTSSIFLFWLLWWERLIINCRMAVPLCLSVRGCIYLPIWQVTAIRLVSKEGNSWVTLPQTLNGQTHGQTDRFIHRRRCLSVTEASALVSVPPQKKNISRGILSLYFKS